MNDSSKNVVAIVQARMGSTRLPGKIVKEVLGKPLISYLLERLKCSQYINTIVLATTTNKQDDILEKFAEKIALFRGSEDDVLSRYADAAQAFNADVIVRITSDCPLIDPAVIDKAITIFLENSYDYVSNTIERTYPRGMDVEVFSRIALEYASAHSIDPFEREHVTPFILNHPELFTKKNFCYSHNYSSLRWTVDTKEDFYLISKLLEIIYPEKEQFTLEDLLMLVKEHPELCLINAHIEQKKNYE